MREIRLVHNRPQQNVQTLRNAQDPKLGATSKTTYRLTSSSNSFTWTSSLAEHMMKFLRFLKDNCKSLVVRLHGFSQDDESMMKWFEQACQWDLIVGIVANNLKSQAMFICCAITNQRVSSSRFFLKINLYPADFNCTEVHNKLAEALQRSNCLNRLEIKLLNVGLFHEGLDTMTRTLSRGIGRNRSIRNLVLSGWEDTAWNTFFADLADRGVPFDQLILEKAGYAASDARNPVEWYRTLNTTKHIGFLSCKNSITTSHCLFHLSSTVLTHLQLTNAGWTSRQIDGFLVQFSQSFPNLSILDLHSNRIDDLNFPRFSALVDDSDAVAPATTPHRRPFGSLKGFLLDGNPILSDKKDIRDTLGPLYNLFRRIPSLETVLDSESNYKTNKKYREKLDKLAQCMRSLAIESPHLGIRLAPAAWPLLLSTANRTLQAEPSLQAQAIYEFLVNASAVLSNQASAAVDPMIDAASTSDSPVDKTPLWLSLQKLLPWH